MKAIRQIVEVKDNQIHFNLPEDFNADKVEVIIISADNMDNEISESEKNIIRERIKNTDAQKMSVWDNIREKYI